MSDKTNRLDDLKVNIEEALEKILSKQPLSPYPHLFEAARYSVLGGGKRLRPLLTLATTEALGGNLEAALIPACTLELVHAYSLIHDDLPCMDDDDYRRGKLTLHKKYSEGHAVLTGDYLLTYAFDILASLTNLSPEKKVKLISLLANRIGAQGMIGGQVMDLFFEGQRISIDTLQSLHWHKTGALITGSIEFGAIISDAGNNELSHLRKFGESIGLAFQIVDDILDVTSSTLKHGRTISSDILNEKSTYVSLLGLEEARKSSQELYNKAINELEIFPETQTNLLLTLADLIVNRNH